MIWFIHPNNQDDAELINLLQSNFAIRLIGSTSSFCRLWRCHKDSLPRVVLLNGEHWCERDIALVNKTAQAEDIQCVVLAPENRADMGRTIYMLQTLMRAERDARSKLTVGFKDLVLDVATLQLRTKDLHTNEDLSVKEARILKLFMESPGIILAREEIKQAIWGDTAISPRTVDSHISRLRKRIQPFGVDIENTYGGGYQLN